METNADHVLDVVVAGREASGEREVAERVRVVADEAEVDDGSVDEHAELEIVAEEQDNAEVAYGVLVLLDLLVAQRAVVVGERARVVESDGLVEVVDGVLVAARQVLESAAIEEAAHRARVQLDHLVAVEDGLGDATLHGVDAGARQVGLEQVRFDRERAVEVLDAVRVVEVDFGQAAPIVGLGVGRLELDDDVEGADGLLEALQLDETLAALEVRLDQVVAARLVPLAVDDLRVRHLCCQIA